MVAVGFEEEREGHKIDLMVDGEEKSGWFADGFAVFLCPNFAAIFCFFAFVDKEADVEMVAPSGFILL